MYGTETETVSPESQAETQVSKPRTDGPECAQTVESLQLSVNVQALKAFVNEIAAISDECRIKIDPIDGLSVMVVDPSHIAMIETGMAKEVCEAFVVSPANAYVGSFGIDIGKLQKYLKAFKARDKDVILRVFVDMGTRRMTIESPTGSRDMSLIDDTDMSDPKVPNLDLPTEIVIKDAKLFRSALKLASEISDHIALEFDPREEVLWLKCEGDMDKMASKLEVEVLKSEPVVVFKWIAGKNTRIETRDTRSLFPLEYLTNMSRGLPDGFRLELGNDYPVKIVYGKTVKLLAPRIESDD